MIITATQKNTRQTALKVRMVANQVKNLSLRDAIVQLGVIERRASLVILKTLRQAIANATHNHGYSIEELTLKSITVTPGPAYKRFRAVSRGRAHNIFKRTCHVFVEIEAGVAPKIANTTVAQTEKNSKVVSKPKIQTETKKESATPTKTAAKSVAKKTAKKEVKSTKKTSTKKSTVKKETKSK